MQASRRKPTPSQEPSRAGRHQLPELDAWLRGGCALVVAGVAAYASYVHQRTFALQGGADPVSASLWPLSVDGLLLLATAALLRRPHTETHRAHPFVWLSFLLGIAVSLAANIAAAPTLAWKPVLVAGWPPIALLLSVELLAHRPTNAPDPKHVHEERATPKLAPRREDPLLEQARHIDARHRELHQRPASAEALRKELKIGTTRARQLNALLRDERGVTKPAHRSRERTAPDGRQGPA